MSGFSHSILPRSVGTAGDPSTWAISGFGELVIAQQEPTAQGTFVHGINDILFYNCSNGIGASVSAVSGTMVMSSGNSTSGSAHCELRRALKYRPGQGSAVMVTAVFGTPVPDTKQLAGAGNEESGYYFGYSGTTFGIFHEERSGREVRSLTVTTGVATTTSVTVTLNGAQRVVSVAGGSSTVQTAARIAEADYTNVGTGWFAEATGSTVNFIANHPGSQTGTYSATGTGLAASFSRVAAGFDSVISFISQSQWNVDTADGTGTSRFDLDPSRGNIYQVQFQYLGFGNAFFSIEDSNTGRLTPVHVIRNANIRNLPVLRDPQVHALWKVENLGSSIATHMSGVSAGAFTEGKITRNVGIGFSINGTKSGITTAVPIISVRANRVYKGKGCYGELDFNTISAACVISGASTRSSRIYIYKNVILSGPTEWIQFDATNGRSVAAYDTTSTGFTLDGGYLLKSFLVTNGQTIVENLTDYNMFLSTGETLTVVGEATNSSTIDVSLSWFEDQ